MFSSSNYFNRSWTQNVLKMIRFLFCSGENLESCWLKRASHPSVQCTLASSYPKIKLEPTYQSLPIQSTSSLASKICWNLQERLKSRLNGSSGKLPLLKILVLRVWATHGRWEEGRGEKNRWRKWGEGIVCDKILAAREKIKFYVRMYERKWFFQNCVFLEWICHSDDMK